MIRNLKALGLSLLALCATSALGASSASAVDLVTSGVSPALLTGSSTDHILKITNPSGTVRAKFECTTAKFAATVKNNDTEITVDVTYEGRKSITPHTVDCTSSFGEMKVDTTGCNYILTGNTTAEHPAGSGTFDAPVWIECEKTADGTQHQIKFTNTFPAITLTIPAQTPTSGSAGGGVTYTNIANHPGAGDPSAVKVTTTVTGVTYSCHPTAACTLAGIPHHGNNTDYNGTVVMTAYGDTEGLPTPVTEGARTSLVSS